ncbi:MAG: cyclic nucleotide-binding domain-containing protein [Myxococcales bacterium]|nr:cyclic nucleotide-binding domain-containing protein [Myxococcales bacterium]
MSAQGGSRIGRELFLAAFFPPQVAARILPRLASAMRDLWFPAGHVLYRAGEPADVFFFVVEGEVRLEGPGLAPLTLGERSVAGIIDVLADRPRSRDCVVTKDAHVLELPSEDWLSVLEDDVDFARGALRGAARGAHTALLALVPDGGFPVPEHHEAASDAPKLHLVERMLVLRRSPLIARASAQALEELAEIVREIRLEPGQTLFERGEGVGRFCFVAHGVVALERDEPRIAARFGPGSVVGGVASVTLETEAYRAHAETRCVVLDVHHDELFEVVEEHFDLGRSLIVMVALENERLRQAAAVRSGDPTMATISPRTRHRGA